MTTGLDREDCGQGRLRGSIGGRTDAPRPPGDLFPRLRKKAGSRVVPRGRVVRARNGAGGRPFRGTHPGSAALSHRKSAASPESQEAVPR